jgi:hypothetical protein
MSHNDFGLARTGLLPDEQVILGTHLWTQGRLRARCQTRSSRRSCDVRELQVADRQVGVDVVDADGDGAYRSAVCLVTCIVRRARSNAA